MLENDRADFDRLAWGLVINLVDYKRKVLVDKIPLMTSENIKAIFHPYFLIFRFESSQHNIIKPPKICVTIIQYYPSFQNVSLHLEMCLLK